MKLLILSMVLAALSAFLFGVLVIQFLNLIAIIQEWKGRQKLQHIKFSDEVNRLLETDQPLKQQQ